MPANCRLAELLRWCESAGASDLHARGGEPFVFRANGQLKRVPSEAFPPAEDLALKSWFLDAFSPALVARITAQLEVDASFYHGPVRYRANFSKQRGRQSFSFRHVPQQRLTLLELQLPDSLLEIVHELRGLILLTGPTGQGKSTTVRALLQQLNECRALRVITVENPIEYIFTDAECHFEQREVGIDTPSFADGIRNAMRQDSDVLFVGENRGS